MATKTRGAPYPVGTDANNTAADLSALAQWVDDRPGVAALTTTQKNALTGVDRWDGKLVLDTTLDRLFRWDAGTTTWIQISDTSEIVALLATSGTPAQDGLVASRGVSTSAARADHVHPEPAWTAYTPGLGGSTVLGTGATLTGRYIQHGKTTHYWSRLQLGTGFTIASDFALTLPVNRSAAASDIVVDVAFFDASSTLHRGTGYIASGSDRTLVFVLGANGIFSALGPTAPFTWATGDRITISGTYEAA